MNEAVNQIVCDVVRGDKEAGFDRELSVAASRLRQIADAIAYIDEWIAKIGVTGQAVTLYPELEQLRQTALTEQAILERKQARYLVSYRLQVELGLEEAETEAEAL